MAMANKYISVFIPVYNGEKYLGECIQAILNQKLPSGYGLELLVTDSGSSDRSVEIIQAFGDKVSFNQIPNSEYGHGKTRQAAAERAKGEFILFVSQDATPSSSNWILNMIEPFFVGEKIGCVFGRQIPRPFSVPTIKREVSGVFNQFGAPNSIVLHNKQSLAGDFKHLDYNYFFSDVNSAIRKDLVKTVPFRDVKYAEDMALAEDMEAKGYIKAYAPRGAVWHSNEYTAREYYHRKFDEYLGLQNSTNQPIRMSAKERVVGWLKPTIEDWRFLCKDREYGRRLKIKYFFVSPLFNINEKRGKYDAIKHAVNSAEIKKRSLESRRKQ